MPTYVIQTTALGSGTGRVSIAAASAVPSAMGDLFLYDAAGAPLIAFAAGNWTAFWRQGSWAGNAAA